MEQLNIGENVINIYKQKKKKENKMKVAIIIPCYNSEGTIYEVVKETTQYMKKMKDTEVQFVLVNDCSKDNTFGIIRKIVEDLIM